MGYVPVGSEETFSLTVLEYVMMGGASAQVQRFVQQRTGLEDCDTLAEHDGHQGFRTQENERVISGSAPEGGYRQESGPDSEDPLPGRTHCESESETSVAGHQTSKRYRQGDREDCDHDQPLSNRYSARGSNLTLVSL